MSKKKRFNKSASWSDLQAFLRCPEHYRDRMANGWNPPTETEAVANSLHAILQHDGNVERAWPQVEAQLRMLDDDTVRAAVLAQVRERAGSIKEIVAAEPAGTRERVQRWLDEKSGWLLCAKPDKWLIDRGVMEIIDYKDTDFVGKRQRDQLFFFGLVLGKVHNHTGPIKLTVRRLKDRDRESGQLVQPVSTWNYSHHRTYAQLEEIRGWLARIDQYLDAESFPTKPGHWCDDCRLRDTCQGRQEYVELQRGGRSLPVVTPVTVS